MNQYGVDLSACDREPIHLIGAIQPHGALMAAEGPGHAIGYASANARDFLGIAPEDLLGMSLAQLLPERELEELTSRDLRPLRPELFKTIVLDIAPPGGTPRRLECLPHSNNGATILEFIEKEARPSDPWRESDLRQRIIAELVRPGTLAELAQLSAEILREVTGFDRVMIYRFAEDKHGEVIAESTVRPDSFLGLHYPASDIPDPARRHFVLNAVRTIVDIEASPVPILGAALDAARGAARRAPLDLTFSKLRAVAPVHVEYLRNMGVRASMSISLVTNDELWGLIACHHYSPRRISLARLQFAELLGGTISALLQGIADRTQLRRSIDAEKIAFAMEKQGREGTPLAEVVERWGEHLMRLLDAQGIVFKQAGVVAEFGAVPRPRLSYAPLRAELSEGVAASDHLSSIIATDDAQWHVAAGAAYLELSEDGADYLVLVREHYEQTIKWAGRPDKLELRTVDGTTRLSPRGSFALWREERVGRSRPFDSTDREALRIIRRALFALNSLERERAAVRARKEAEAEEERLRLALLDAARRTSMGELASALAHELNQPLSAVTNYVNACRQELHNFGIPLPDTFHNLMHDAVEEATRASDLVKRLRAFIAAGTLAPERIDLHATIVQAVDLALMANGIERARPIYAFADDLPPIWADPVQVGQVVLNLALNAMAAMREASDPSMTVATRLDGGSVLVSVSDTGPGIAPDVRDTLFEPFHSSTTSGMGIGLSLCRSIVEAHGGRIWADHPARGAEIVFSLPIDGADDAG